MGKTSRVLHPKKPAEEHFNTEEKQQLQEFVSVAADDYDERIPLVEHRLNELKRQVVRAEHELKRLKNHRGALATFSTKHELTEKE